MPTHETTKRGTRMWGVVTPRGKAVQVARTKAEAEEGFRYMIEIERCRLVRVIVTVEAGER